MSVLDELQVGLVLLPQTLQQQLVLGPLQLQLPHLEDGERGQRGGRAGGGGFLRRPSRWRHAPVTAGGPRPLTWASRSASRA